MTAPARTDADLRSLNWWKALIALALLLLLILCWLGILGGRHNMAATAAVAPTITAPIENEELDAQQYVLEGTGTANDILELWQSTPDAAATLYDTVPVGADGQWGYVITGIKPGTKPGTYTYELRKPGSTEVVAKRTVIVKAGLTSASNAKCPCKLRIFTLRKQNIKGATIILSKDGQQVQAGADPKLFTGLEQGVYTYSVSAPGYETYTSAAGKVSVPRNKNFEVYLKPVAR